MLALQLLGGVSLTDEDGAVPTVATQRRRLALLARLAAAPNGTLSRDKLIGCFWPDEERERARHFLADSLFTLRKALGRDLVLTVGDDLQLNRQLITCDLWRFQDALQRGAPEEAVSLCVGPFLDGFFVSDAPEFERWAEEERTRVTALCARALETLAGQAESRDDPAQAVAWYRRLAAQDPYSARVAMLLMHALAASGNRAAAVQHARIHAALLREELELEPDPEVEAFASRLAAGAAAEPPSSTSAAPLPTTAARAGMPEPAPPAAAPEPSGGEMPAPAPAPFPAAFDRGDRAGSRVRGTRRWRRRWVGALLLPASLLALIATAAMWGRARHGPISEPVRAARAAPAGITIAVLPFDYRGSPDGAYLAVGMVTLLSSALDGAGALRTVSTYALLSHHARSNEDGLLPLEVAGEMAADLGAERFILGTVVETGGQFIVQATMYEHGPRPRQLRMASEQGADVGAVVDALARRLVAEEFDRTGDRLPRLALTTNRPLPALKAYLQGEAEFRAARYPAAAEAFARAVREDSTFALAHFRLSMAQEWSFRFDSARRSAQAAQRHAGSLSERDQRLVRAWRHFVNGEADAAEREYQALLAEDAHDVEAWSGLGEVRLHFNPVRGRPTAEAAPAFEEVLRLAPDFGEARFHLMEFAAREGNRARFDSLLAAVPDGTPQRLAWEAARALAWNEGEAGAILERLERAEDVIVGIAAVRAAAHFRDLDAAQRIATLMERPQRPESWRAAGQTMSALGHLARGDRAAAAARLEAVSPVEPAWALEIAALGALLPGSDADAAALRGVRDALEAWDPRARNPEITFFFGTHHDVHTLLRHYLLALLSLRLGEEEAAGGHAEMLRAQAGSTTTGGFARALAVSVAAHRAFQRGDAERTLRLLDSDRLQAPLERVTLSPFFSQGLDRHLRAEALRRLGRDEEALRVYGSLTDGPDLLWWRVAHGRQAELLERMGRGEEAQRHRDAAARLGGASTPKRPFPPPEPPG